MKKVSKERIVEYVFVIALLVVLVFILLLNYSTFASERDHIRWHKEHANISVKEHNPSIAEVVASVDRELNSSETE